MTLLLLALFIGLLISLFYYELVWKKMEQETGKSFVSVAGSFLFGSALTPQAARSRRRIKVTPQTNWSDWKYRLLVELHRRERLDAQHAARLVGVSESKAERYLDKLESDGKVQQVGDAERGLYYKVVNEV